MGTCCSITKRSVLGKIVAKKLTDAIEQNNLEKIKLIILKSTVSTVHKDAVLNINSPIVKIYNHDMNALGYALFLGHLDAFILILEVGRANLIQMSILYTSLTKRPIDIICELGHKNLLEYYLPFYLTKSDEIAESDAGSMSLSFTKKSTKTREKKKADPNSVQTSLKYHSPLHRACQKGRLNVVQFIYDHFLDKETPSDFDIHHQDERTGENCALVSCKTGMIHMMQYLYEVCKADFHILNKRGENALQILAVSSKKKKKRKFLDCLKYLIESISVDYTYQYEETLLVLEDVALINYLEEKLKNDGISISKSRVEDLYAVHCNKEAQGTNADLDKKLREIKANEFYLADFMELSDHENQDEVSSIEQIESSVSLSMITIFERPKRSRNFNK